MFSATPSPGPDSRKSGALRLREPNERGNIGITRRSTARIHELSAAMPGEIRDPKYWISTWSPVALGILIIAAESTSYFGADRTSGPLRWIFQGIRPAKYTVDGGGMGMREVFRGALWRPTLRE